MAQPGLKGALPGPTRLLSVAVLLWWMGMCGALIWREYFAPQTQLGSAGAAARELEERDEWMGIYAQGQKIGYSTTRVSRGQTGFLVEERATLRLSLLGIPREVRSTTRVRATDGFLLEGFEISVESGATRFEARAEMGDSVLAVEISSAGRLRRTQLPVKEMPWVPQTLRYMLLLQGPLQEGKRFRVPMLDPLTLTAEPMEIVVEGKDEMRWAGRDVSAWRLSYSWAGLRSRAWVSPEGEVLREEGFGGLSMVRETREQALGEGWALGRGVDLFRAMSVPAQPALDRPRELSYLKVRFSGADLSSFSLAGGRQRRYGSEVEVIREDLMAVTSYALPHAPTSQLQGFLAPSPLIQSDDAAVQETFQRVLGGERDALKAVWLLLEWVHDNLEKLPTLSVPSAVEVLNTRQGDCNEHAVLFAALARAAGIPTKLCAGILYQDGRFYYHAWNEVFLGQWFSLDPILGQFPADATHVKFVEGELDSQARLVSLIGNLKAEILGHR
jgi:hypothetical protein